MGRGRRDDDEFDVGDDPEKYKRLREKLMKEKAEKKAQQEKEESEVRVKERTAKNEKLEFKPGLKVVVRDLVGNKEKNGLTGTLDEFNTAKERWAVKFDSGGSANFKIGNLELMSDAPSENNEPGEGDAKDDIPTSKIYITNLSEDTVEDNLISLFSVVGVIAKQPVLNAKGKSKGFEDEWPFAVKLYKPGVKGGDGMVEFVDRISAKSAIKAYNGYTLKGSQIGVEYASRGGKQVEEPRQRSRSRERIARLERERQQELKAVQRRLRENEPISEDKYTSSKYFG